MRFDLPQNPLTALFVGERERERESVSHHTEPRSTHTHTLLPPFSFPHLVVGLYLIPLIAALLLHCSQLRFEVEGLLFHLRERGEGRGEEEVHRRKGHKSTPEVGDTERESS